MFKYPPIMLATARIKVMLLLVMMVIGIGGLHAQNATGINGILTDGKGPIPGAIILIQETKQTFVTSDKGDFTIHIKPGIYTLEIRFIGFKTLTRRVAVNPGQVEKITFTMQSDQRMLGSVNIEASKKVTTQRALLEVRKASTNIQDAIGAVEIEKTASITTAQALQRVTGVTVKDGKYITVRGLSDRNIVVQMNGSRMASADAGRSAVSVDLIPAQLLENIIVEKSMTPDKPGDANGALVEIRTKSIPDKQFLEFNMQTGYNGNIGVGGYSNSFADANMGFFGQNVKKQNLTQDYLYLQGAYTARGASIPLGTFANALKTAINSSNIDQAHYNEAMRINRVMEQGFSPYLTTKPKIASPDQIYGITAGTRYNLKGEKVIGLIVGLNYYNRSTSNPDGSDNLYTVKVPTATGIGEPNIIYPNENRLVYLYNLNENTGQQQLNYGGLATLAFRFNRFNELSVTYNGNYGTEANATLEDGHANPTLQAPNPNYVPVFPPHQHIYDNILRLTERSLNSVQLRGADKFRVSKKLKPWGLDYSASYSSARQNDPDYRETRMRVDSTGSFPTGTQAGSTLIKSEYKFTYFAQSNRYYRTLTEQNNNDKVDLTIPFSINKDETSTIKAGGYYFGRKRDYQETLTTRQDLSSFITNAYGTISQQPGNLTTLGGDLDLWSSAGQVGVVEGANVVQGQPLTAGYLYTPQPGVTTINGIPYISSYHATQDITAFYAMTDLHPTKNWRIVGGIRIENTDYQSTPDTANTNFKALSKIVDQEDFERRFVTNYLVHNWLPSGSIIYKGIKNINFRVAYSKTLIRPEINEITLTAQHDPIQQVTVYGNKNLLNGTFTNYDFRTDWFIGDDELVSGSVFYKTVMNQLERVYQPTAANASSIDQFGFQNSFVSFRNNPNTGKAYGLEFEVRKNLKELFEAGKYISFNVNMLFAKSETVIDPVGYRVISLIDRNASTTRPLVDQPNYALNVNADFDQPKWGTQVNLLFNKTGKRLSDINADGTPNIYEYPASTFDIVYSQRITKRLQFKAFGKNLLNSATQYVYANAGSSDTYGVDNIKYVRRQFAYGSVYTFGFKYTF